MKWKRFYPNIAHATERNERLQKILINPTLVALMVDGLRNAAANGYDLSNMSDLDIGTEIARGIREFEHVTQDELARAVREAWQPDPFPHRSDARDAAGCCCRGAAALGHQIHRSTAFAAPPKMP